MSKFKAFYWIAIAGFVQGCAHKATTDSDNSAQSEYERVMDYCKESSNAIALPVTNRDHDPSLPPEFETGTVGYDECMQRYWPEHPR